MKLNAFIDGLNILRTHFEDGDGFHIGAEHDQFYVYKTDTPLDSGEVGMLRDLGWFQPEVEEDENGDAGPYDPEEGWSAWA